MNLILFGQMKNNVTYWTSTIEFINTHSQDIHITGLSAPDLSIFADSDACFTIEEAYSLYQNHQIDGILNIESGNYLLFSMLESHGFARKDIYIIPSSLIFRAKSGEDISKEPLIRPYHEQLPELPLLEVHLADQCNLNCKGCAHFSNLARTVFPDAEVFERDVERLSTLFSNITQFFLLGGEPLLNPDFPVFIRIVRKYFPYAQLTLLSNGLLVPSLKEEHIQVLKENRVNLDISAYRVIDIDKITAFIDAHGLSSFIRIQKSAFTKFLNPAGTSDKDISFNRCPRKDCNFLANGKVAPCCLPFTVHYFNEYFGEHIPENECMSIYGEEIDGWKLLKYLNTPMETCRYCTDDVLFEWDTSKAPFCKDDWCV